MKQGNRTLALGAISIGLATILAAFGSHGLKTLVPSAQLIIYETAVRNHFFQSLGLLAIGLTARIGQSDRLRWAAGLVMSGTLLFCGSLYLLSLGAPRWLGAVAPLGGIALIAGWFAFAITMWRDRDALSPS